MFPGSFHSCVETGAVPFLNQASRACSMGPSFLFPFPVRCQPDPRKSARTTAADKPQNSRSEVISHSSLLLQHALLSSTGLPRGLQFADKKIISATRSRSTAVGNGLSLALLFIREALLCYRSYAEAPPYQTSLCCLAYSARSWTRNAFHKAYRLRLPTSRNLEALT